MEPKGDQGLWKNCWETRRCRHCRLSRQHLLCLAADQWTPAVPQPTTKGDERIQLRQEWLLGEYLAKAVIKVIYDVSGEGVDPILNLALNTTFPCSMFRLSNNNNYHIIVWPFCVCFYCYMYLFFPNIRLNNIKITYRVKSPLSADVPAYCLLIASPLLAHANTKHTKAIQNTLDVCRIMKAETSTNPL